MDELLAQFLTEGRDLVAEAHDALRALDRNAGDMAAIDALFRATHTLKGSVALFDMAPAEALLHAAETPLARARRDGTLLSDARRDAMLATIDQVDRWIDAMEADTQLPDGADAVARQLIQALTDDDRSITPPSAQAAWLDALTARPQFAGRLPATGGTAFRYTPDPDCFFRGDDPLATVALVPDLVAFAILPTGEWPSLEMFDPFRCAAVIEGVSAAEDETVRAAFRLVPDQVEFSALNRVAAVPVRVQAAASNLLRVEGAKLDRLARQAGELAVAVHGLAGLAGRADRIDRALGAELRRAQAAIERASGALRNSVGDVRLVSLAPVLRRLPRLAREVAVALDKDIAFTITGDATEADKQVADALFEPLLHLVRNAIDHGIESPAERAAVGKPPQGRIVLAIKPHGERLLITLTDDGRGIDPERVRQAAVAKGLIDAEDAAAMGDMQVVRLIFAPGFSTASAVSGVSGRGVGMDAVQTAIERLQGIIDLDGAVGAGTIVRISLPLNAITTRLLTVSAGGELYGLRLDQIVETIRVDTAAIQPVGQGEACVLRDRAVPVVDLGALLGRPGPRADAARLILTEATGEPIAIRVDALGGRLDAVVRERTGLLAAMPAISGTAVLGDGGVLLVLDLPELVG